MGRACWGGPHGSPEKRRHTEAIRARDDLRGVHALHRHSGEPRARGRLVARNGADGLERPAPGVVRGAPTHRGADGRDPVARGAAGRPCQAARDLGGVVVGLPARRAHAVAPGRRRRHGDAHFHARRADGRARPEGGPGRLAERGHRERVPERAERADVSVGPRCRLLHAGPPVSPSLHRVPGDLPQGTHRRGHAGEKSGRDPRAKAGELPAGLGRAPAGAVLPAVGIGRHGRDPLRAPRADRGRPSRAREAHDGPGGSPRAERPPPARKRSRPGARSARLLRGVRARIRRRRAAAPRAESRAARLSPGRHRGGPGHEEPGLHQEPRRPSARAGARQRAPALRGRRLAAPAAARPARVPSAARPCVRRGDDRVHRAPAGRRGRTATSSMPTPR